MSEKYRDPVHGFVEVSYGENNIINSYPSDKYAAIISQVCEKSGQAPGKKMVQKLMYLVERSGVELDLNYSIHFYGPYSAKLDNMLHILENKNIIQIDTTKPTHYIKMQRRLEDKRLEDMEQEKVTYILERFIKMTASELEAITTIDYTANNLVPEKATDEQIINEVKKIKGNKFSEALLYNDLELLKREGFIS